MTNGGGLHTHGESQTTTKETPEAKAQGRPTPEPKDGPKQSDAATGTSKD